jgi:hypothetical protein
LTLLNISYSFFSSKTIVSIQKKDEAKNGNKRKLEEDDEDDDDEDDEVSVVWVYGNFLGNAFFES